MRANKCEIEGGWSLTQGFSVYHFVNGDIECGPNHGVGKGRIQYDHATRSASYALPGGRSHGPSVGPLTSGMVATLRSGDPSLAWIRFTVGRLPKAGGIAQLIFTSTESVVPGLPFTYTDDICQIGEHDVCFSGIELTKEIGEFKVGQKFDGASIDFQGGHLTLETADGREHRYSFELKVAAKHEGHTCSGCGLNVGEPCRQHAGS